MLLSIMFTTRDSVRQLTVALGLVVFAGSSSETKSMKLSTENQIAVGFPVLAILLQLSAQHFAFSLCPSRTWLYLSPSELLAYGSALLKLYILSYGHIQKS